MSGARRVQDLDAYQLAVHVRRAIFRLTKRGPVASDFKFVDQIRDAARGGSRNISEGFSRFAPNEFRRYLTYARSSLNEVADELEDGFDSEYFTEPERDEVLRLLDRTNGAISRLMEYLESPSAQRFYEQHRKARRRREWEKADTSQSHGNSPSANENPNQTSNKNPSKNPNENPNPNPNENENKNENENPNENSE